MGNKIRKAGHNFTAYCLEVGTHIPVYYIIYYLPFYCLLANGVYKTKPTIPSPSTLTGMYKSVRTSTKEPKEDRKSALRQEKRNKSTTTFKVWQQHSIPSKDIHFLSLHKHHKIHRDMPFHAFHLLFVRQPICQHSKSALPTRHHPDNTENGKGQVPNLWSHWQLINYWTYQKKTN